MRFSNDGITWSSWETYNETKTITLPEGDGQKTVYFSVCDKAGNEGTPVSAGIILDSTPPHSLSNIINDDATETNQTRVFLKLKAEDDLSGVSAISFSDDGLTWSPWENYTTITSWDIEKVRGQKTIYFRAKDEAGNIATPVSATIFLNITAPPEEKPDEPKDDPQDFNYLLIPLILILVVVILIVVALVFYFRRKKQAEKKAVPVGAVTIKPRDITSTSPGLPGQSPTTGAQQVVPTQQVPSLLRAHQGVSYPGDTTTQQSQPAEIPSLPPAQIQPPSTISQPTQTTQEVMQPTMPTPLPTTTPTPTQQPQPQVPITTMQPPASIIPTPPQPQPLHEPPMPTTPPESGQVVTSMPKPEPVTDSTPELPDDLDIHLPDSEPQPEPTSTTTEVPLPETQSERLSTQTPGLVPGVTPEKNENKDKKELVEDDKDLFD